MAKKKRKARPRKRQVQTHSFLFAFRRMFIWACVLLVCFMGYLFLNRYLATSKDSENNPQKVASQLSDLDTTLDVNPEKTSNTSLKKYEYKVPVLEEFARLQVKRQEQVINHEGYTVSYNSDYKIANWVAYELTATEARSKKVERSNKFVSDPRVKGASATNEDYTRTGYDRGHLAPAGDMKWSLKAMRESFYLSNICPQKPGLNRGLWKDLEEQIRLWALDNESLLIVTGPVISDDLKRLGKNRVGIPRTFYKVVCSLSGNNLKGIAFLFENRDYKNTSLKSMAIPIDSVEKVTGIDFFYFLPDAAEKEMEASIDWNDWSF